MNDDIPPSERPTPPDAPPPVTVEGLREEVGHRFEGVKAMVRSQRAVLDVHAERIEALERKFVAFDSGVSAVRFTVERTAADVHRIADWLTEQQLAAQGVETKVDKLLSLLTTVCQLLTSEARP